jgi:hypothetical protein
VFMKYVFLGLAAILTVLLPSIARATCEESAGMVHSFALMRDKETPLAQVHKHIDSLNDLAGPPGGLTKAEISEYYKALHSLADAAYDMRDRTPDQLKASFYAYCKSPKR